MKGSARGKGKERKQVKRALALLLAVTVIGSMMPMIATSAANAETAAPAAGQQTQEQQTDAVNDGDNAAGTDSQQSDMQTKSADTYTITSRTYLNGVENTDCGTITPYGAREVSKGKGVNYRFAAKNGYKLAYLMIDNKKVKPSKGTYSFTNVRANHTIYAYFTKIQLKVLIDPGHYKGYNRGCIRGYYEGNQMWVLGRRLMYELNKYPQIQAKCTKNSIMNYEMGVYKRGTMAKGYDVLISMHSNYCSSSSTDYVLSIVSSGTNLKPDAYGIGKTLAKTVNRTMGNRQGWQIWTKRQRDGRDWFGVIRGAASKGVPSIILEHSFHSNKKATRFLMNKSCINKLAANEAKAIVSYYGVSSSLTATSLNTPANFKVTASGGSKLRLTWSKTKYARFYQIYRATSLKGSYSKIATVSASNTSYTNTGLHKGRRYYYRIKAVRTNQLMSPLTSVESAVVR